MCLRSVPERRILRSMSSFAFGAVCGLCGERIWVWLGGDLHESGARRSSIEGLHELSIRRQYDATGVEHDCRSDRWRSLAKSRWASDDSNAIQACGSAGKEEDKA